MDVLSPISLGSSEFVMPDGQVILQNDVINPFNICLRRRWSLYHGKHSVFYAMLRKPAAIKVVTML